MTNKTKNKMISFISVVLCIFCNFSSIVCYANNSEVETTENELIKAQREWEDFEANLDADALEWIGDYSTDSIEDMRAAIARYDEMILATRDLPSAVDNTSMFPQPGTQAGDDCVTWAVSYAKTAFEKQKRGWTVNSDAKRFSPAFLHYVYGLFGNDLTTSIPSVMNYVKNNGQCSLSYFPYENVAAQTSLTSLQIEAGKLYKDCKKSVAYSITSMKNAIYEHRGVVIGLEVYPQLYNLTNTSPVYNNASGVKEDFGHSVCIVGYNDNIYGGAFKFINSWGTAWGANGYAWIPYSFYEEHQNTGVLARGYSFVEYGSDNYILGDVNEDNSVTAADARLALRVAANLTTLTDRQNVLADVDGNAHVTSSDASNILKYAAREIPKMPIYN